MQEIANQVGCETASIYKILQKQHVKEYILSQTSGMLLASAPQAMVTQRNLLKSKSEYIRHKVASDLLDRNEIGNAGVVIGQAVQVKIDLS